MKRIFLATVLISLILWPLTLLAQQTISPELLKLLDSRDDKRCKELGAQPSTDTYVNCRLKLQEMRSRALTSTEQSINEQQILADQREALKQQCRRIMAAALMAPTLSGNFGESTANANAAYANCMAGLPPPPPPAPRLEMRCVKDPISIDGGVTCTEQ